MTSVRIRRINQGNFHCVLPELPSARVILRNEGLYSFLTAVQIWIAGRKRGERGGLQKQIGNSVLLLVTGSHWLCFYGAGLRLNALMRSEKLVPTL